ncbi:putative endo-1,3-beta-glucanase [Phytophthora cinnamomi]|uniref:putative endo-1,3-beta-glucanase n=1 Tax=Phytophthora cinnamomi TaxID=4785 RepID=UPI00355AC1DF|nr:putative endo-1,3-beta-glucanase [Phytophthora cinnamomi]
MQQSQHAHEKQTLLDGRRVVRRRFGTPPLRVWELRVLLVSLAVFVGVYVAVELTKKRHPLQVEAELKLFKPLFDAQAPPGTLFPYTDEQETFLPPMFMAPGIVGSRPIPTNNWWGNMIAATQEAGVQPIWANPYSLQPMLTSAPYGLTISYPYPTRVFGGGRSGNGIAEKFYRHGHVPDFTFSAMEFTTPPVFEVFDWDDLSVQVRFKSQAGPSDENSFEATLVSGMAFVTAKYASLTPRIDTVYAILTVNDMGTLLFI